MKPIPSGKKGFRIEVGKKLDEADLRNALHGKPPAAVPGDTVQITSVEFHPKAIIIEINGGGKGHFNLRDHLQIGVGGPGSPSATPPEVAQSQTIGATLILDFGRNVPDMSADDVMTDLQAFLDFSKEHSGAVNWIDTLPPQFKQAITDHEALEGMNHEMVLAALGRPGTQSPRARPGRHRNRRLDLRHAAGSHHLRHLYRRQSDSRQAI